LKGENLPRPFDLLSQTQVSYTYGLESIGFWYEKSSLLAVPYQI